jgi:hypothetical protein
MLFEKTKSEYVVVGREYNSSPCLGQNRVENLEEKICVYILVVYAPETILRDNKFLSRRNAEGK